MLDSDILSICIPKYLKNFDSLNYSYVNKHIYNKKLYHFGEYCFEIAKSYNDNLISGNLDGIKLLYEIYPKIDTLGKNNCYVKQVIENGLYNIAKWLVGIHGKKIFLLETYLEYNIFEKSIIGDNLKLIKYILFLNNMNNRNLGDLLKMGDGIYNILGTNGNFEIVKFFVENININVSKLFLYLANNGHLKCMKYLMINGDINGSYTSGNLPLLNSCFNGRISTSLWLLDINRNIDLETQNMIFAYLAKHGRINEMKDLLKKYPNIDIRFKRDYAFEFATINGHLDIIKWLLEKDIGFSENIKNGITFKYAFLNVHYDILEYCLELEPELINNKYIKNVVISRFHKLKNNHLEMFLWITKKRILNTDCFGISDFLNICKNSDINFVKYLLNKNSEHYLKYVDKHFINSIVRKNISLAKYFIDNKKIGINIIFAVDIWVIDGGIMTAIDMNNINLLEYFLQLLEKDSDHNRLVCFYYKESVYKDKINISKYLRKKYNFLENKHLKYSGIDFIIEKLESDTIKFIIRTNIDYFENEYKNDYIISEIYGKIYFRDYLKKVKNKLN